MATGDSSSSVSVVSRFKSVAEVDAAIPIKAIEGAKEGNVQKVVKELKVLSLGLAVVFFEKLDPRILAIAQLLGSVNLGLPDVDRLVDQAIALLTASADRDALDLATKKATIALEETRIEAHDASTSCSNLIRAKLGTRSEELARFGIKGTGARRGTKRAAKPKTTKDGGDGGSGSDSGTTPKA